MLRRWIPLLVALAWLLAPGPAAAEAPAGGQIVTPRGAASSLAEALAAARDGDTIEVIGGIHAGPLTVDHSIRLIGRDTPILDGNGQGTVLRVTAPDVTISGFTLRGTGISLDKEDAALRVDAARATVIDNNIEDALFGILLSQAAGSTVRGNSVAGKELDLARRGDPIRLWESHDVSLIDNVVHAGRDVVLWYSNNLTVRNNRIENGRYGLHFMFCDDAVIEHNRMTGNSVGAFLMYSRNLTLRHNVISANRGPSGYAIGLKDVDDAVIEENLVHDNRVGAFVDTSPREVESTVRWTGNVFAYNDVGLDLMPSISRNYFTANSFVENEQQVSIAGGGLLRGNFWSVADRGNYWSDYAGYDGDGDGVGDLPYKTERLFENLMDTQPALRLFLYSPVEQAVDFAARAVPFVRPQPTLTDEAPLMAPIMPAGLPQAAEAGREPLWLASAAMVAVAFLLLGLDSFRKYRVGQGWALDWPAWPASAAPVIPNQSDSHG